MSLNSYLIVGARPYGEDEQDIRIINGSIAEIGIGLDPENLDVVQAKGRVCLPSFVDLHTHLREPGREDAETIASGSRAATLGGFSAVFAMANT
ncbi:MAG: amidohydrolase family protein, partial [Candidatus Nanopelagicales bacterium]